jgi:hypothetical protein
MIGTGGATGFTTTGRVFDRIPPARVPIGIKGLEGLTGTVECGALIRTVECGAIGTVEWGAVTLTGEITECVATRIGTPEAFKLPTGN